MIPAGALVPLLYTPEGKPLVVHECQRFHRTMQRHPDLAAACERLLTGSALDAKDLVAFEDGLTAQGALFAFSELNTVARARACRLGTMLHWGLSQPWAASIPLDALAVSWWQPFDLETHQAHLRTAAIFVDFLEPLSLAAQGLGSAMPTAWYKTLFDGLEKTVPWPQYSSFKKEMCHPVFLAMGLLCCELDAAMRVRWSRLAKKAIDTMDEQEQNAFLDTVLASSLKNAQKRQVAQALPPALWLQDLRPVQLSGVLALNETQRFPQLGWGSDSQINWQLCQLYCPAIAEVFGPSALVQWETPSRLWKRVQALNLEPPDVAPYANVFGTDFAI